MCWCGTEAQSEPSLRAWLNRSRMTCFILSSSQKKKKNHNYTDDRRRTKMSRPHSLTRWIAHCAAGTFPSAFGWRPYRCGCRIRWWEPSPTSAGTVPSGWTCAQNKQTPAWKWVLAGDVCFPLTSVTQDQNCTQECRTRALFLELCQ